MILPGSKGVVRIYAPKHKNIAVSTEKNDQKDLKMIAEKKYQELEENVSSVECESF